MIRYSLPMLAAAVLAAVVSSLPAIGGDAVDWSGAERVSDGIEMVSLSRSEPRLIKAKAMRVDLSAKSFFFTGNGRDARWGKPMPYYTNLVVRTRRVTAEEFLMNARAPVELGGRGLDMVVAFNTALWTPCPEPIPTPYGQLHGLNISDGVVVSPMPTNFVRGIFVVWKNGGMDILPTPLPQSRIDDVWIAHSGWDVVLTDGKPIFTKNDSDVHPRTVLGLSRDRRWFYVLVVEGRHEGVSIGADYVDLADMMLSLGASDAINMDGGGSTELVRWDDASQRQVTCFTQETPPRRDALFIGICRRAADSTRSAPLDGARMFEAAIDGDRSRSAGLYHRYEFDDVRDTPPPQGYRPFYISHYGRHGSRYQTNKRHLRAFAVIEAAEKAGELRTVGKELMRRLRPLVDEHKGMLEELSVLGGQEHVRLAKRMYKRFPGVFKSHGRVRCQASVWTRCHSSMANFACALKGEEPRLDFEFATGQRYMDVISHPAPGDEKERNARIDKLSDDIMRELVKPDRLVKLLFKDSPAARKIVGDPRRFVADLFKMASAFQSLDHELGGLDIYDYFTRDETLALARYWNCHYYLGLGNSTEFGDCMVAASEHLAKDVVERADEALQGGDVCADLRFGHDSGLFPLAALLGVEGVGVRVPTAESWKHCQMWRQMPMAANIQLVFCRNDSGDCLVKILYNEHERLLLKGLAPVSGPYYRWSDLRRLLLDVPCSASVSATGDVVNVNMAPGERWWGAANFFGTNMPFTASTDLKIDLRRRNYSNQCASLLISDQGRVIWADAQSEITIKGGKITMDADSPVSVAAADEKTLAGAYRHAMRRWFPPSGRAPDPRFFTSPQLNTWIELTYHQNQKDIIAYAKSMVAHGIEPGVIMIDDTWQTGYGDWRFDATRFPDPKAMIGELHAMGFKVMLWMCPYVGMDTPAFRRIAWGQNPDDVRGYAAKGGFLLEHKDQPKACGWWNGYSAFLDFSHPNANAWFAETLDGLVRDFGVDGFKLDGADLSAYNLRDLKAFDPKATNGSLNNGYCAYALKYPFCEIRNTWRMQQMPVVVRLHDKKHEWGALARIVADMIGAGLIGQPFICPDMVGGGDWVAFIPGSPFEQELFIRSAQIHAFSPMMQISASPWRVLDAEHQAIFTDILSIRRKFAPKIAALAEKAGKDGEPILRNLEYNYPGMGYAGVIDEFMLGDDLLVAPVIKKGTRARKVVVPPGRWRADDGAEVVGPCEISVSAPLSRLPHFVLTR